MYVCVYVRIQGGTLPLNPFGESFRDALFVWDQTLCETDSDGDGYSNGVELGDPCCLFNTDKYNEGYDIDVLVFNGVVSTGKIAGGGGNGGQGKAKVSHPGFAHASPETVGSAYAGLDASSIADMCVRYVTEDASEIVTKGEEERAKRTSHREDPYLDGERRVTLEVQFPRIDVLPSDTTYGCSYIDLSEYVDDPSVPYHLVGFKVNVDNIKFVHHMLLKVCDRPGTIKHLASETYAGGCYLADEKYDTKCSTVIAGWNPGGWSDTKSGVFSFPEEAGYPVIGRGARFITVQTHYTNVQREIGSTDASSIDLYVTPDLRPHDSATMMLGPIVGYVRTMRTLGGRSMPVAFSPIAVPPGIKAFEMKADCHVPEPITIWATRGHGHLNMASLYVEHYRPQNTSTTPTATSATDDGLELVHRFGKIRQFDYEYQPVSYTGEMKGIDVARGDTLRSFCIFNTEDKTSWVYGGASTFDEMCVNYLFYYPAIRANDGRCIDWTTYKTKDIGENPFENGTID